MLLTNTDDGAGLAWATAAVFPDCFRSGRVCYSAEEPADKDRHSCRDNAACLTQLADLSL